MHSTKACSEAKEETFPFFPCETPIDPTSCEFVQRKKRDKTDRAEFRAPLLLGIRADREEEAF